MRFARDLADYSVRLWFSAGSCMRGCRIAAAQTFQNYRCADGTQFIVGFFQYDSRAHLQLDGKAVTLAKRLALSARAIRAAA